MAEMKTFNGLEIVDAKARQNIEAQDTRLKEVEKFFEAADTNGVIDKLAEVQKYIEDDAEAAAALVGSIAAVDAKVDAIEIPEVPTKVSAFENDANYTDKTYVDNAVKNVEVDLTGYATEQWVEDKKYLTQHQSLAGLATETYVNEQIDAIEFPVTDISGKSDVGHKHTLNEITDYTAPDLTPYAKKTEIPTKVSQLDNDKNYLTDHQSLEAYATKTYVNNAVANVEVDLTGYATQTFVNNKVAVVSSDLTSYVDTSIPKKVSELQNDANYLVTVPEEYVTETELEEKDFATESFVADVLSNIEGGVAFSDDGNGNVLISPSTANSYVNDFSNYYTKAETAALVEAAIEDIEVPEIPEPDLTGYATEQFVLDRVAEIDIPEVPTDLSSFNNDMGFLVGIPDEYITESELEGYATESYVVDMVGAVVKLQEPTDTTINLTVGDNSPVLNIVYRNPIQTIEQMTTTRVQGHSIQFKTASSITVTANDNTIWIGDDCEDNVFNPTGNTNYEVYSYYNRTTSKTVNMVMNLGA